MPVANAIYNDLFNVIKSLPESYTAQVFDYVSRLKAKAEREADIGIDGECPICAKLRDPVTGNLPYNAETIAAMEESRAAMRGEIPVKWHKPHELEQVWKEMLED